MKPLPRASKVVLAIILSVHLILIGLCFGVAIYDPERGGLAPVFAYLTDLPASWVFIRIARLMAPSSYDARRVVEAVTFAALGSIWWFLLVSIVSRTITTAVRAFKHAP
jgi:hypothetical protein